MKHFFKKNLIISLIVIFLLIGATFYWNKVFGGTITSTQDGNWSEGSTWVGGVKPGAADAVIIKHTVTYNENTATEYGAVTIFKDVTYTGILTFAADQDTNLDVAGDITIQLGAALRVGTVGTPIGSSYTATIKIVCSSDGEYGIKNSGELTLQGTTKTSWVLLEGDVSATGTSLTVQGIGLNWANGDEICIAPTDRDRTHHEQLTINSAPSEAGGNTSFDITPALSYGHQGSNNSQGDDCRAEVGMLTHNVVITSKDTSYRGYIIIYSGATANVDYAEFYLLGYDAEDKYGVTTKTTGSNATDIKYSSIWGAGASNRGLYVDGADNMIFQYNTIYGIYNDGIYLTSESINNNISNNFIVGNQNSAYYMYLMVINDARNILDGNHVSASASSYGSFVLNGNSQNITSIDDMVIHDAGSVQIGGAYGEINNLIVRRNGTWGGIWTWGFRNGEITFNNSKFFGNTEGNIDYYHPWIDRLTFNNCTFYGETSYPTTYGIRLRSAFAKITAKDSNFHDHTYDIRVDSSGSLRTKIFNTNLSSSTPVSIDSNALEETYIKVSKLNQTEGSFKTWYRFGTISDETTAGESGSFCRGGTGVCVYMDPSSTTAGQTLNWEIKNIRAMDSIPFDISFYVKKTSVSADPTLTFSAEGAGITPISNDSVTLTDSWTQYTSSQMTPTEDGFVTITLKALDGSTTGDIGIDDLTVSGPDDTNWGQMNYWLDGLPEAGFDPYRTGVPLPGGVGIGGGGFFMF